MARQTVPYITSWSGEAHLPMTVIHRPPFGIAYADETLGDRDEHGVLWARVASSPGRGRPRFGQVHALRQRRAMRGLLCQVCGGPADRTDRGVLWLLKDHRGDWPGWPEHMACTEPPVCLTCAHTASRVCPALRKGHIAVRVRTSTVCGVYGVRYRMGHLLPTQAEDAILTFDDPAVRWTRAEQLVRELRDCSFVNL